MLDFERRLVAALTDTDADRRQRVGEFVEGSLEAMPEHLRLGVLAESVAFATWARLRGTRDVADLVRTLEASPIALVRQYVRLFRSLVLFAEQELAPA